MITLSKVQQDASVRDIVDTAKVKINGQVVWDYKDNDIHREIRIIPSPVPIWDDPVYWKEIVDTFGGTEKENWDFVDEVTGEPIVRYAVTQRKTGDVFLEFFTE